MAFLPEYTSKRQSGSYCRIPRVKTRRILIAKLNHSSCAGQYMCFAKNEWGTATSNSVFVRAAILNNFKEQPPITKTVEEGKPFKLPCEAPDGWPKPNIYWMIQVSPIP